MDEFAGEQVKVMRSLDTAAAWSPSEGHDAYGDRSGGRPTVVGGP